MTSRNVSKSNKKPFGAFLILQRSLLKQKAFLTLYKKKEQSLFNSCLLSNETV